MEAIRNNPWTLLQQPIPCLIPSRFQGHLVKGLIVQTIAAQIVEMLSGSLASAAGKILTGMHQIAICQSRTIVTILYAKVAYSMGNSIVWLINDKPLVHVADAVQQLGGDCSKVRQAFEKAERLVVDLLPNGNALVTLGVTTLGLSVLNVSDGDGLSPWLPFSALTTGTLSVLMGLGSWMLASAISCESERRIPPYHASLPFPGLKAYITAFFKMQGLLAQGQMKTEQAKPLTVQKPARVHEVPSLSNEDSEFYCSTFCHLWSQQSIAINRLTSAVKSRDYERYWEANLPAKAKLGVLEEISDYSYIHRVVKSNRIARDQIDEILNTCEVLFTQFRTHLEQKSGFTEAKLAEEIALSHVRKGSQKMALFMPLKQLVEVYYMVRSSYGPQCHLKERKATHIQRGDEPGLCCCLSQDTEKAPSYNSFEIDKEPGRLENEMVFYQPGTQENRWRETFNRVIANNAALCKEVMTKNRRWQGWLQQDQLSDMKFHSGRTAKLPLGNGMKSLI